MSRTISKGSLIVVGTGIRAIAQVTAEAISAIRNAEIVHYIVCYELTERWINALNPRAKSLSDLYGCQTRRDVTYDSMVERVLDDVRAGKSVCMVAYGHPGVYADPTHAAVRQARFEGFEAYMQPAVSAEDCLFADLGVDPSTDGLQSFEATDFLAFRSDRFDPHTGLLLWQIGGIGVAVAFAGTKNWNAKGVAVLAEVLSERYGSLHVVSIYETGAKDRHSNRVVAVSLEDLSLAPVTIASTLFVPPLERPAPNQEMLGRIGLTVDAFKPRIASEYPPKEFVHA